MTQAGSGGTPAVAGQGAGGSGVSPTAGRSAGGAATAQAGSPATGSGGTGGVVAAAGSGGAAAAAGSGGSTSSAGAGGATGSSGSAAAGSGGAGGVGGVGGAGAGAGGAGAGGSSAQAPGMGGTINGTQIVARGQTFDGGGKRYTAGRALGDGSQDEGQQPMFRVEAGGTLKNVVLGAPAADGIHTYGDATLENIVWEDIGEDAMTIKESGTVTLNGGSASNGDDKVFQINAPSTFKVSNFTARSAGKFIRQNGDTTFKVAVEIDSCDISRMDEAIFRTDSSTSTVKMTNTRYSQIGDQLFIGVSPGNITESGNMEY
jgi:pectate lyase C